MHSRILLYSVLVILLIFGSPRLLFAEEVITLSKALEIARKNNLQYQMTQQSVDAAEAGITTAAAYPNPEVNVIAGGITELDVDPTGGSQDRLIVGGELSQELELWGRRGLRKQVAQKRASRVQEDLKTRWLDIEFDIKRAYYQLLLQNKLFQIASDNLDIGKKFVGATELKHKENEVPFSDVLRARLELVNLKTAAIEYRENIKLIKQAFNLLLGRSSDTAFRTSDTFRYKGMNKTLSDMVVLAMRQRPELEAANLQREELDAAVNLIKRQRIPNPKLSFWGEKEGPETKFGGGLGFELPVWNRKKGEIREASALRNRAVAEEQYVDYAVKREVSDAFRKLAKAANKFEAQREGIEASAELIRTSFQSYLEGRTSFLMFLDTLRAVKQFKKDYYTILALWHVRRAELERAVGSDI